MQYSYYICKIHDDKSMEIEIGLFSSFQLCLQIYFYRSICLCLCHISISQFFVIFLCHIFISIVLNLKVLCLQFYVYSSMSIVLCRISMSIVLCIQFYVYSSKSIILFPVLPGYVGEYRYTVIDICLLLYLLLAHSFSSKENP